MIELEVNGKKYSGYTRVSVTKTMEALCGFFSFDSSNLQDLIDFPNKIGAECKIYIDGELALKGFITRAEPSYTKDRHIITVSGYDVTVDVRDSTMGNGSTFSSKQTITLKQIALEVMKQAGITNINVIDKANTKPFAGSDIVAAETGQTIFHFLEEYAQQRQVLVTTDNIGNLIFTRAGTSLLKEILNKNLNLPANIIRASGSYDNSRRFYKYIAKAQTNDSIPLLDDPIDVKTVTDTPHSESFDDEIRKSRTYYFNSNTDSNTQDAIDRAKWENNYRKSHSFTYMPVVSGFSAKFDKRIWQPNYLVKVVDNFFDLDTTLLITRVKYDYDIENGAITTLTLRDKDSFTQKLEKTKIEQKQRQGQALIDPSFKE